jgi:3-hydroxyisobutyrate dehydrogenase-like beta-hydroxyacid dehydrogenase
MTMAQVGFLGLGNMGSAMAQQLVSAGHELVVWNRTPSAADELVAAGARRVDDPAEALAAPISHSMLANDDAVEAVLSAANLAGAPGRIHVNHASISAAAADRVAAVHAAAGVAYVASPVLGRPVVAAAGNLNVLVAGPEAAVAAVMPHLEIMGQRVWNFGTEPRRANVAKIAINFMILHALESMGESVALVEAHGLEAADFVELFSNTLFGGVVYTGYGAMIAEKRYQPAGFAMPLGLKDLSLAEGLAAEANLTLPTTAVLRERFASAMADPELSQSDWSAVAEVTRRSAR